MGKNCLFLYLFFFKELFPFLYHCEKQEEGLQKTMSSQTLIVIKAKVSKGHKGIIIIG